MKEQLMLTKEIFFQAPADKVWGLLTDPNITRLYMFGCEVLSEWKPGSRIVWKGLTPEEEEKVFGKGEITSVTPFRKVSFTMLDPNMGIEDIPENYVLITYELEPTQDGTTLTIIQGDFNNIENGAQRLEDSRNGWEMVIPKMKELVEA